MTTMRRTKHKNCIVSPALIEKSVDYDIVSDISESKDVYSLLVGSKRLC
jgi:hypothetical protein